MKRENSSVLKKMEYNDHLSCSSGDSIKIILDRLEKERDMALSDISRLQGERDALRERIRVKNYSSSYFFNRCKKKKPPAHTWPTQKQVAILFFKHFPTPVKTIYDVSMYINKFSQQAFSRKKEKLNKRKEKQMIFFLLFNAFMHTLLTIVNYYILIKNIFLLINRYLFFLIRKENCWMLLLSPPPHS